MKLMSFPEGQSPHFGCVPISARKGQVILRNQMTVPKLESNTCDVHGEEPSGTPSEHSRMSVHAQKMMGKVTVLVTDTDSEPNLSVGFERDAQGQGGLRVGNPGSDGSEGEIFLPLGDMSGTDADFFQPGQFELQGANRFRFDSGDDWDHARISIESDSQMRFFFYVPDSGTLSGGEAS